MQPRSEARRTVRRKLLQSRSPRGYRKVEKKIEISFREYLRIGRFWTQNENTVWLIE